MSSDAAVQLPDSRLFRLTHILRGHEDDVKAVRASAARATSSEAAQETIYSASRGETGRLWKRSWLLDGGCPSGFQTGPVLQGKRYANAIAHLPPSEVAPAGQTILGSLDALIRIFETSGEEAKLLEEIIGHYDNITSFDVCPGAESTATVLISGSWDTTARVWELRAPEATDTPSSRPTPARWVNKHTLKGHPYAVWGVAIVDAGKEQYLTTCADSFVRLFVRDSLHLVYAGHTDVARGIAMLPAAPAASASDISSGPAFYAHERLFVTCSNDTTLRVWSLDERRIERPDRAPHRGGEALRVLRGHSSLVYDVAVLHEPDRYEVASCGEDGAVLIWDWIEGTCVTSIPQPVLSVWSIAVLPLSHDIVTGSSDGLVRVYSHRVHDDTKQAGEVTERELEEHNLLCNVIAKQRVTQNSSIIATERETKAGTGSKQRHTDGELYDAILSIDVSDDAPPLELPMNNGDDLESVVDSFLAAHDLPATYRGQIINFVRMLGPSS